MRCTAKGQKSVDSRILESEVGMMMIKIVLVISFLLLGSSLCPAQNANSSTSTPRPRTTNSNRSSDSPTSTNAQKTPTTTAPRPTPAKPVVTAKPAPTSDTVLSAFETLLNGIRKADVAAVTGSYWNSPRLILFNNNGTVTRGWTQMKQNRQSSYRDLKDVKLEVKDVAVTMLGRDGAVVTCLWTQSQTYKDTPETASGRMTLVFRRIGKDWKAVHLHTSPDKQDPTRVLPSEQTPSPSPSPTPENPH